MRHQRYRPYAKFLVGIGSIDFPVGHPNYHHDTFLVSEPGAGLDYNLTRRVGIRGDFGYQIWSNFGGQGLHPILGTIGAYWRF
jgi:hypothetical protein